MADSNYGPDRYIILEEPMTYDVSMAYEDPSGASMFCPFTKDGKCKERKCMMFVNISIRDKTEPIGIIEHSTDEGRCGLVNIPAQTRMFIHFEEDGTCREYFIGNFYKKE